MKKTNILIVIFLISLSTVFALREESYYGDDFNSLNFTSYTWGDGGTYYFAGRHNYTAIGAGTRQSQISNQGTYLRGGQQRYTDAGMSFGNIYPNWTTDLINFTMNFEARNGRPTSYNYANLYLFGKINNTNVGTSIELWDSTNYNNGATCTINQMVGYGVDSIFRNFTIDYTTLKNNCSTDLANWTILTRIAWAVGAQGCGASGCVGDGLNYIYLDLERYEVYLSPNTYPSYYIQSMSSGSVLANNTWYLNLSGSDAESDTVYLAKDCDYPIGGNVSFNQTTMMSCVWSSPGEKNVAYYATDSYHGNEWSINTRSYFSIPVYVRSTTPGTPECNDNVDNDGDGQSDYPYDTGCLTIDDTTEADCGDLTCNGGETWQTCPGDCPASCGDSFCNNGETCSSCPGDCGNCGGGGGGGGGPEEPPLKECPVGQTCLPVCSPGTDYDFNYVDNFITDYQDVEVPNYIREQSKSETCGIDADQDGYKCDGNEDFISCPKDCAVNVADLLCYDRCMWTEEWFIQSMVVLLSIFCLYMVFLLI